MQIVTNVYKDWIQQQVRNQFRMRLTFHYPSGDVVYENPDIVKVTEKKSAHLVAGEVPTIELSIQLLNIDKSFDPNDVSGLHDMLIKGVWIDYEYGYDVPKVKPYGYEGEPEETYEPVYGITDTADPDFSYYTDDGFEEITAEAYGYLVGYETEWIAGGTVISDGDLQYDKTSVTITARDYLSLLDDPVFYDNGSISLGDLARTVIGLTDYPEHDDEGETVKNIVIAASLDAINTSFSLAPSEEEAISPKEWLQTIAHAGGVKFYIDRLGYIHLDNEPEVLLDYTVTKGMQAENPEHTKAPIPKKLTVKVNDDYESSVSLELSGSGDEMVVENPYAITTAQGETLLARIEDYFIPYRNIGNLGWRGDPALDVLDQIKINTEFGDDIPAIVEEIDLTFDGTLNGSLRVRYDLGGNVPEYVKITGGGAFVIPLGATSPSPTSKTLTCVTDIAAPTYQWSYFSSATNTWVAIGGATTSTLVVDYDDTTYFGSDSSTKFRCVVNETKGALTYVSVVQRTKSSTSGYRGVVTGTDTTDLDTSVTSPEVGDVALLNNTDATADTWVTATSYTEGDNVTNDDIIYVCLADHTSSATDEPGVGASWNTYWTTLAYGETYIYDGEAWQATEASDALALSYKDALALAESSGLTIYSSEIYANLIVAKRLRVEDRDFIAEIDGENGIKVTYEGENRFSVDPITGKVTANQGEFIDAIVSGNIYSGGEYTGSIKNGQIESVDGTGDTWVFSDTDAGDDVVDIGTGQTRYERMPPATTGEPDGTATVTGKFVYPKTDYTLTAPVNNTLYHGGMFDGTNYIFVGGNIYFAQRNVLAYGTSISGLTYSYESDTLSGDLYDIAYGNSVYVAVGGGRVDVGSPGISIIRQTSTLQAITGWATPFQTGSGQVLLSVAFGDNKFVTVGHGGQIKYSNSDGTTWTDATSGTTASIKRVRYFNSYFYAVGDMGILRSSDGITWASVYSAYALQDIAYDGTTLVAVGNTRAISTDGTTWTDDGYYLQEHTSIIYNDGYEFNGYDGGRVGGRLSIGSYGIIRGPANESAPNIIYNPTFLFNVSTTSVVVIYDDSLYVQEFPIATNTHNIYAIAKTLGSDSDGDYIDITLTYTTGGTLPLSNRLRIYETSDDFLLSMSIVFDDRLRLKKTLIPDSSITQIGDSSNLFPKIFTEDLRLAVYTEGSQVTVMQAYGCRAWVNFDGTGTFSPNPSEPGDGQIRASENVSSVTDNGTGDYTVNFENDMPDTNYAAIGMTGPSTATPEGSIVIKHYQDLSTSAFRIKTGVPGTAGSTAMTQEDYPYIYVVVFR